MGKMPEAQNFLIPPRTNVLRAVLTEKHLLFNSIAFLSQTELLTHFESVSVALLLTETYFLRIQTLLEMT